LSISSDTLFNILTINFFLAKTLRQPKSMIRNDE